MSRISYLEKGGSLSAFLKEMSLYHTMGEKYFFQDTDLALEYFEDCLLRELLTDEEFEDVTVLERLTALRGLSKEELKILSRFLNLEHFEKHDIVIRQGDKGDALFFIIKGSADVTIDLPGTARKKRLQTFSSGTFFGEMAFLDGRPRSANVEAREPLDCYRLKLDNFEKLKKEHPHISTVLMTNISRTLSRRLRFANEMISELEM